MLSDRISRGLQKSLSLPILTDSFSLGMAVEAQIMSTFRSNLQISTIIDPVYPNNIQHELGSPIHYHSKGQPRSRCQNSWTPSSRCATRAETLQVLVIHCLLNLFLPTHLTQDHSLHHILDTEHHLTSRKSALSAT